MSKITKNNLDEDQSLPTIYTTSIEFSANNNDWQSFLGSKDNWIKLNIGGQYFETTKATISKDPNSLLYNLCCDPHPKITTYQDENGAYFIDRDPHYFIPILNYLRSGVLIVDHNISEEGVYREAQFYNISSLIIFMDKMMEEKGKRPKINESKNVYRMFTCKNKEEEINDKLATLIEGWKLFQIVPLVTNSTILVIVSKEVETLACYQSKISQSKAWSILNDSPK